MNKITHKQQAKNGKSFQNIQLETNHASTLRRFIQCIALCSISYKVLTDLLLSIRIYAHI